MNCNESRNLNFCNCSYNPYVRKGICCDYLQYHLKSNQFPACCFPDDFEKTYDRSFTAFAHLVNQNLF